MSNNFATPTELQRLTETYRGLCSFFSSLDREWHASKAALRPDMVQVSMEQWFIRDHMLFLLYLATADGWITPTEVAFINRITSKQYSVEEAEQYAETFRVDDRLPIPEAFAAALGYDMENRRLYGNQATTASTGIYDFYRETGALMIRADNAATPKETERLNTYLNAMRKAMNEEGFYC